MNAGETERDRWAASGVFKRLEAVIAERTPVQIKRSTGEMVTGYVFEVGFGGMGLQVVWGVDAQYWAPRPGGYTLPKGCKSKVVNTEDFLEWNPTLAGDV